MEIKIGRDLIPHLTDVDDFKRFSVTVAWPDSALREVQEAMREAAPAMDAGVAWVLVDWVRTQADRADDPAWSAGFGRMVDDARGRGWARNDAPAAIRAHIDWHPQPSEE